MTQEGAESGEGSSSWADFMAGGMSSILWACAGIGGPGALLGYYLMGKHAWRDLKAKYPTMSAHKLLLAYVAHPEDPTKVDLEAFVKSKAFPRARGGSPAQRRYRRLAFHKSSRQCLALLDRGDATLAGVRRTYQKAIEARKARDGSGQ